MEIFPGIGVSGAFCQHHAWAFETVVVFPADFGNWDGTVDGIFAGVGGSGMEEAERPFDDLDPVGVSRSGGHSFCGGEL